MRILTCINKIKANFDNISDIYDFIHVFILIGVTSLLLKLISVKKILGLLSPRFEPRSVSENEILKLVKYTDYLLNFSFLYFDKNCLKRSLILFHLLRKRGIDVNLNLGLNTNGSQGKFNLKNINSIEGHAWLSVNNEIYLDSNPDFTRGFTIVFSYP